MAAASAVSQQHRQLPFRIALSSRTHFPGRCAAAGCISLTASLCVCVLCLASIARRVYLRGGVGVGEFSRIYGGLKSNGARRPHYAAGARGVIRHILQQLQELDLVAKRKERKGRFLTRNGQRELDTIAGQQKHAHSSNTTLCVRSSGCIRAHNLLPSVFPSCPGQLAAARKA